MPTGHSLAPLADVPDRQRRHGPPELVVGCKRPLILVPVLARRRAEGCGVTCSDLDSVTDTKQLPQPRKGRGREKFQDFRKRRKVWGLSS